MLPMARSSPGLFSVAVAGCGGHQGGDGGPSFRGVGVGAVLRAGHAVAAVVVRQVAAVVFGWAAEAGLHLLPHVLNGKEGVVRQEVPRREAKLQQQGGKEDKLEYISNFYSVLIADSLCVPWST